MRSRRALVIAVFGLLLTAFACGDSAGSPPPKLLPTEWVDVSLYLGRVGSARDQFAGDFDAVERRLGWRPLESAAPFTLDRARAFLDTRPDGESFIITTYTSEGEASYTVVQGLSSSFGSPPRTTEVETEGAFKLRVWTYERESIAVIEDSASPAIRAVISTDEVSTDAVRRFVASLTRR